MGSHTLYLFHAIAGFSAHIRWLFCLSEKRSAHQSVCGWLWRAHRMKENDSCQSAEAEGIQRKYQKYYDSLIRKLGCYSCQKDAVRWYRVFSIYNLQYACCAKNSTVQNSAILCAVLLFYEALFALHQVDRNSGIHEGEASLMIDKKEYGNDLGRLR